MNDRDAVKEENGQDEASPAVAFARFVELSSTPERLIDTPSEELLELVVPFLENPRHRPHVEMILEGLALQRHPGAAMYRHGRSTSLPARMVGLPRIRDSVMKNAWKRWQDRGRERLEELKQNLSPGKVRISILPATSADTEPEYRAQGLRLCQIQLRLDVEPATDVWPALVSVRLEPEQRSGVEVIDVTPKGSMTEEGTFATEDELVRAASTQTKASLGVKAHAVNAGVDVSSNESLTVGRKVSASGTRRALKIISGAAEQTARWQFMRTADQVPAGGFALAAWFLVADNVSELTIQVTTTVEFEEWGSITSEVTRLAPLPPPLPSAASS